MMKNHGLTAITNAVKLNQ